MGDRVPRHEAEQAGDQRDEQQGVTDREADDDNPPVLRKGPHAANDDHGQDELHTASDRLEESHNHTSAMVAITSGDEGEAIDHRRPPDGVPDRPGERDGEHHRERQARNEVEHHKRHQPPGAPRRQDRANGEAVVDPSGRDVHVHGQTDDAHHGAEAVDADPQYAGDLQHEGALERFEGGVHELAGEHDAEKRANVVTAQKDRTPLTGGAFLRIDEMLALPLRVLLRDDGGRRVRERLVYGHSHGTRSVLSRDDLRNMCCGQECQRRGIWWAMSEKIPVTPQLKSSLARPSELTVQTLTP